MYLVTASTIYYLRDNFPNVQTYVVREKELHILNVPLNASVVSEYKHKIHRIQYLLNTMAYVFLSTSVLLKL